MINYKNEAVVQNRIWELDFLRGMALICMVYFHLMFDLEAFFGYSTTHLASFNYYVGKASAILFMLVSGISCQFSRNTVRRGLQILAIALGITVITHLADDLLPFITDQPYPKIGVKFGVLHFFGVSILLYPVLKKINRYMLVVLGLAIILSGQMLSSFTVASDYLFPLGIVSNNFYSSDFYPLIPWLGVFLTGIALGKFVYQSRRSIFHFPVRNNIICSLGKRTLLIYIIHQPILFLFLALCKFFVDLASTL